MVPPAGAPADLIRPRWAAAVGVLPGIGSHVGTRLGRAAIRRLVGPPLRRRGATALVEGVTLLTVDYHTVADATRLVRSFQKFVGPSAPVVLVCNGPRADVWKLASVGATVVTAGVNLHHGLGLDFGMRYVRTRHTLICDPDTVILSPSLWPDLLSRVGRFGAASIDNGAAYYHPACLAFETRRWKESELSLEEQWPAHDVAGALTRAVGGLQDGALLPRTRAGGPALASTRPGRVHHLGEIYADAFSNTYCLARKAAEPDRADFDGWSRETLDRYHERWRAWADGIVDGGESLDGFPA